MSKQKKKKNICLSFHFLLGSNFSHDDIAAKDEVGTVFCDPNKGVNDHVALLLVQWDSRQFGPPLDDADSSFHHLTRDRSIRTTVSVKLDTILVLSGSGCLWVWSDPCS